MVFIFPILCFLMAEIKKITFRIYFLTFEYDMKFKIQCPALKLIGTLPHLLMYILPVATFMTET
jgi:hypothetical protein